MLSRDRIERQLTDRCFGCGQRNPIGLKLRFRTEGNSVVADFTPADVYEGYPGYLHGGIIGALLDEAMGWAAYSLSGGTLAVTAKVQIRFRRPVLIGETLTVSASITRKTRQFVWTEATLKRSDGKVAAEAAAVMSVSDDNSRLGRV